MSAISQIDEYYGYPNDELARQIISEGLDKLDDIQLCKAGLLFAMSHDEKIQNEARQILMKLIGKHDRSPPFMILKWLIQINNGRDKDNLSNMITDWAKNYPENIAFSRTTVYLKLITQDSIEKIGSLVSHLEKFWNDTASWAILGKLYEEEKLYDRAVYSYDEAYAFHQKSEYLTASARCRLLMQPDSIASHQENKKIAVKQLAKAVILDNNNLEALDLLIKNTSDDAKKKKYIQFREKIQKAKTD